MSTTQYGGRVRTVADANSGVAIANPDIAIANPDDSHRFDRATEGSR